MTATTTTLGEFIARLKQGDPVPRPDREGWSAMIARTTLFGRVCEVAGETYDYFLDVLPPRWMGDGGYVFGEGADPLRLFWAANTPHGRQYLCRQLDEAETRQFCQLARIARILRLTEDAPMFHDDRTWCVRPQGTPEAVAMLVTRRTWPPCTSFAVGGYLFLNDSLPEDGSTDYAVVKRPTAPGGEFVQVASLTLGFWSYENALDLIRSVLAGDYDAPASTLAVDPHLEPAAGHIARRCPFCS